MEYTLAEKTILLPPFLVALLVVIYRNSIFCFHCSNLYQSVNIVSDEIMETVTTMIHNTQNKALIIHESSESFFARCFQSMAIALNIVQEEAFLLVMRIQGFFITIYQRGHTSIHQTTNFIANIFHEISQKIALTKNETVNTITYYFTPTAKPFYEQFYTPAIILTSFCILAFTIYYLQKNHIVRDQPTEIEEASILNENPSIVEKKPAVRRKNRNSIY